MDHSGGEPSVRIKVGDMVTRRSHGEDIVFYVTRIIGTDQPIAQLIGVNVRLFADSPCDDLIVLNYRIKNPTSSALKTLINQIVIKQTKPASKIEERQPAKGLLVPVPGKVLHIDGEQHYLEQSLSLYKNLNVPVIGRYISEVDQPQQIKHVLAEHKPDILVITGHDGLLRRPGSRDFLINYRSSQYFVNAVKQARLYETDKDSLVIIAGACQSHYEALMEAGANFASAPERVMIHCYDPVFIAEKISYTSFTKVVDIFELLQSTISGYDGIGGLETRGKLRYAYPHANNWSNSVKNN